MFTVSPPERNSERLSSLPKAIQLGNGKPGPLRSETRLCPLVSLLKSPPAMLQAVASPTCPSGGGTLLGAGRPRSPIGVARLSPLLLPSSSTSHVLSCHCGPQDVLRLPAASPIKSKRLSLFSKALSMPRPHLSVFSSTRSAPAKLICLLSPRPCCCTGHLSCSWCFPPHLCCSAQFCKTPDQNWAFSTGTHTRAAVLESSWVPEPSGDVL